MLTALKIELYKVYKRPLFLGMLAVPLIICLCYLLMHDMLLSQVKGFMEFYSLDFSEAVYFELYMTFYFNNLFAIAILCFYYFSLEAKNQCHHALFTLPQKPLYSYLSKITVLFLLVLLNGLISYIGLSIFSLLPIFPEKIGIPDFIPVLLIGANCFLLGVFHFALASTVKKPALYFMIFIALFAFFALKSNHLISRFLPYYYATHTDYFLHSPSLSLKLWIQPLYLIITAIVGYYAFKSTAYGKHA